MKQRKLTAEQWEFVAHINNKLDDFGYIKDYCEMDLGQMFFVANPEWFTTQKQEWKQNKDF